MKKIMAILMCSVLLIVGVGLASAQMNQQQIKKMGDLGAIDVTVNKADGNPADGWTIEVTQISGQGSYHLLQTADVNGHALFSGCPTGQYLVEAYKTPKFLYGSASTDQVFVTAPATTFVQLTLAGGLYQNQ